MRDGRRSATEPLRKNSPERECATLSYPRDSMFDRGRAAGTSGTGVPRRACGAVSSAITLGTLLGCGAFSGSATGSIVGAGPDLAPSQTASDSLPAPVTPSASAPPNAAPYADASTPATLLITELPVLRELEANGFGLGALFVPKAPSEFAARSLEALSTNPTWKPVLDAIARDVADVQRADSRAGVHVARFSHRLFDVGFLRSPAAHFELVAVVNRLDRANIVDASCGETRFVYRLAYDAGAARASRLPLTVGVEVPVARDSNGCKSAALRWVEPKSQGAAQRAAWLRGNGPLSPAALNGNLEAAQVVVNVQLVRWPSTVRPDLGGHAEYALRAFRLSPDGHLRPTVLENTIDTPRLQRQPQLRKELLAWLRDPSNIQRLDTGTLLLPDRFLARQALSVAPRGLSRLQNRPFSSMFSPAELQSVTTDGLNSARTPAALLRRLDQLSCPGCHQARSIAGFHLLGEDPSETPPENSLAVPLSPHVAEDLERRAAFSAAWLGGQQPGASAPHAERSNLARGSLGAHCDLGLDGSYAAWGCDPGLHCAALDGARNEPVGRCVSDAPSIGDACEVGVARPASDPHRDGLTFITKRSCASDAVCNRSAVGFPGGMCTPDCGATGAVCGNIAILDPFNACLGRGGAFIDCVRDNVTPAGLRPCDADTPCRDDYVCARAKGGGACIPPYFVFQLRVDGHTLP
jgi:hypothetical protein